MIDFDNLALTPVIRIFGKPATYTPPGESEPLDLPGLKAVFEAAHEFVDLGGDEPVSATQPAALVRLSDFPAEHQPERDGVLSVGGKGYTIIDIQPDGEGGGAFAPA